MVVDARAARGVCGLHPDRRRSGAAVVELAAAAALRLETDYVLAGARPAGADAHSLWRIRPPTRVLRRRIPAPDGRAHGRPHGGPLGAHESRGTGAIPSAHPRALRIRSGSGKPDTGLAGPRPSYRAAAERVRERPCA